MEEKIQKMVDFAIAFQNDPDFNRLVFPMEVIERLEKLGVRQVKKEYTAAQAIDKCFAAPRENKYTTNTVEVIDQTSLPISFPPFPWLGMIWCN
jgi:hypothetical protein